MSSSSNSSSGGIGVLGLLGVVFITLKLCHVINWSWWCVLAPFWGGIALFVAIFIVIVAVKVLIAIVEK
jgi:hypothetical protein